MASSTAASDKVLCATCGKGKGTFKCQGCSQMFCPKHSIDHRHKLDKHLEEIEVMRDLIQETLNQQQTKDPNQHSLIEKIDQWEQQSITKIRQAAEEARKTFIKYAVQHTVTVQDKLQHLTSQLRQGREDDDFIETDITQWMKELERLRTELDNLANVNVREDSGSFVNKICVNCGDTSDVFERICGKARIEESGGLVLKDQNGHTELRGKGEYTTGRHVFRFRIEELPDKGWIFFGVVSKSTSMQESSYGSPSTYGWSNQNQVYVAGNYHSEEIDEETFDAAKDDIIALTFDCDRRRIQLTNERTNRNLELPIDTNVCLFPWQFHLNLYDVSTGIRILQ